MTDSHFYYVRCMPVVATDQFTHRKHLCPICGWRGWSVWGHARRHWESHTAEERREYEAEADARKETVDA